MKFNHIAYRGSLFQTISRRAALAAEMAHKLKEAEKTEDALRGELEKLTPPDLKSFVENSGVLSNLFQYGRTNEKIAFNDSYNFGNSTDVKEKLKRLARVWKDVVKVDVNFANQEGGDENGRIEVWFFAFI